MTVEVQRNILGIPTSDWTPVKPGTTASLCIYESLIRPHTELYVYPNPSGNPDNDEITIKKIIAGEISSVVTLSGKDINKARESQSIMDGYRIRSV